MGANFWTLPVFIFSFPGLLGSVAGDIQFDDYTVVDQSVNGRRRCHGILEDHHHLLNGRLLVKSTLPRSYR